jgi:hypothetical protein
LQIATNFTIIYRIEERETLSQLPVVDLGEDFDFTEEFENKNTSINENENNSNKIQENKRISLEAWSKGHVANLKVRFLYDFRLVILVIFIIYFYHKIIYYILCFYYL